MKLPLTISLLASNRISTLERCLDSLKPLLLQVPAELIIVFTGTDIRIRQVAQRYTNQIIPFTWCDNFSAARNTGLKHAKGEWFLYLDDDEWFDDVTEICEFFRSGEYQHYNFAAYVQRNYLNQEGSRHVDAVVYRMARRHSGLYFEGSIHEELRPYLLPCKLFQSYVHHYGYIKNTAEKRGSKALRNIPLLLKEIEKQPNHTKNYVQLAQEYCTQEQWDQAEDLCRKGRSVCLKEEDRLRSWLQVVVVEVLYKKEDYIQAEREALQILDEESPCELVRLLLLEFLLGIYNEWKNYQKLSEYGIEFESLLTHMEQHPELWLTQQIGTVSKDKVMYPEWLYPIRLNCARAELELKNLKNAEYFLGLLPWEDEYRIHNYYPLLDQWKETYAPYLTVLLAKLPYDSSYLLFQRLLYEEQNTNNESETKLFIFRRCLKEINHPYLQKQLIEIALRKKTDLTPLLKRIDLDSWKTYICAIVSETPYEENGHLWETLGSLFTEYPLQGLWLKKLLLEKDLSRGFLMKEQLLQTLEEYAECIRSFYQAQYHNAMFEDASLYLLPADCRMALAVLDALDNWKHGNLAETIRLFRQVLQIYPQMTGVVREILRLLKNETALPAPADSAEFDQLSIQMKAALKTMIQSGQYAEAMSVLSQLLPLLPNDTELLKLQQQLLTKIY